QPSVLGNAPPRPTHALHHFAQFPGVDGPLAREQVRIPPDRLRISLRGISDHGPRHTDDDDGGEHRARGNSSPVRSPGSHRRPRNAFAWVISGRTVSAFRASAISLSKYSVAFGRSPAISAARAAP